MAAATPVPQHPAIHRDQRDVVLAWACLIASPVFFVLAFVTGEGLGSALDADTGTAPPFGVGVLVVGAALIVFAIPAVLAWWFARRAKVRGDTRGRVPAIVLTVLVIAFAAQNLLAWVMSLVLS
jgi:hypothetical protein